MKNNYLFELRLAENLNISQMAEKLGLSRSFYEKIENGYRKPSRNFIEKMLFVFPDVDVRSILFVAGGR